MAPRWAGLALLWVALAILPAKAQEFAPLQTTLASQEDLLWLDMLDRNNSVGGRNGDLGVLKRWEEDVDRKYLLDLFVLEENPAEDYLWSRRPNGVRWMSGSITKRDLATFATFKTEVGITKKWDFGARFDMVRLPRAHRGAFRLWAAYNVNSSTRLEAHGHIDPEKPGTDLGAAVRWTTDRAMVRFEVWMLDTFNDFIYVTLNASSQPQIDYTEDYATHPFALRAFVDVNLATDVRFETFGAWYSRSVLHVYDPYDPSYDFRNGEDTWYAGGLLEWKPTAKWLLNVFATNWESQSQHLWEDDELAILNDYDLDERTTEIGVTSMLRLGKRWELRAKGRRDWRPEERVFPSNADSTVSYQLDSWLGQVAGRYQSQAGFLLDVKLAYLRSEEPLGTGQVPSAGDLSASQWRFGYEFGWRIGPKLWFTIGAAHDFGPDESGTKFGGARGRGVLSW